MGMDLGQFDDEVWGRFFDFLNGRCDDMDLEELGDLLGVMDVDIRRALKRVNEALEGSRLGRDRDVDF